MLLALLLATSPEALRLAQDGVALAQGGELGQARVRLEAAQRLAPEDPGIVYNLAQVREALGDLPGAREAYARYLELSPRSADSAAVRRHLRSLGGGSMMDSAADGLTGVADGTQSPAGALSGAGRQTLAAAGSEDGSPVSQQQAGPPAGGRATPRRGGLTGEAAAGSAAGPDERAPADPELENAGPPPSAALTDAAARAIAKGDVYFEMGRYEDAERAYLDVTQRSPGAPEGHRKLADAQERQEKYAEASESLRRYERLVPRERQAVRARLADLEAKADELRARNQVAPPSRSGASVPASGGRREAPRPSANPDPPPASAEAVGGPDTWVNITANLLIARSPLLGFGTHVDFPLGGAPGSPFWFMFGISYSLLFAPVGGTMVMPVEAYLGMRYEFVRGIQMSFRGGWAPAAVFSSRGTPVLAQGALFGTELQLAAFVVGLDLWLSQFGPIPALRAGFAF